METAAMISEIILSLMQAYVVAKKESGKTEEEAKAELAENINLHMAEFLKPVDPVKE